MLYPTNYVSVWRSPYFTVLIRNVISLRKKPTAGDKFIQTSPLGALFGFYSFIYVLMSRLKKNSKSLLCRSFPCLKDFAMTIMESMEYVCKVILFLEQSSCYFRSKFSQIFVECSLCFMKCSQLKYNIFLQLAPC